MYVSVLMHVQKNLSCLDHFSAAPLRYVHTSPVNFCPEPTHAIIPVCPVISPHCVRAGPPLNVSSSQTRRPIHHIPHIPHDPDTCVPDVALCSCQRLTSSHVVDGAFRAMYELMPSNPAGVHIGA